MTPFDDWLRLLKSAGKGPLTLYGSRGRAFSRTIHLTADYTGGAAAASLRLDPDASGSPLVAFTVSSLVYADPITSFTISLSAAQTAALPSGGADDFADFAFDILLTPSGGVQDLLFGGTFTLLGRVTA